MTTDRPIRVAIADDQSLVRIGLRMVLESEPDLEVVGEAADGRGAIALVESLEIDVMLMDVRMPDLDGIAATESIVAGGRPTRILVLTTFDLDEYAFAAIRAGASGFLLKDSRPADLVGAIRTVHAGEAALSPRVTRRMIELFAGELPGTEAPIEAPGLDSLTPREREILIGIAEGRSNPELAEQFFLSESTVKTHVGRVLQKLDARDRVQLVIYAYEHGLLPMPGSS
ncbi:response regulator transcription factor [Agromyces fucosus]|uniref:Response regulator transcription factor n=1 Tax=Agromyces fucosus TaxID=41985 RepID=A0A4Q2JWC3_9MICO|nr:MULTISPECIES: response regulator transcription factor [Agromyces]KQZ08507.1 LuxR family transcriptional regulator [Agromyces sp. Root1464]RXZ50780.1 response regulator transcription factor [Agromyces fucosus]